MTMKIDHDLHIHSYLSPCSGKPEQNAQAMLAYAKEKGLSTICVTDHFWDETIPRIVDSYRTQTLARISEILPLPACDGVRFLFGCETELDRYCTLGLSAERMDAFDFIIVPTTHFHARIVCAGGEDDATLAKLWVERFDAVLDMPLPFEKVGIAHLTDVPDLIPYVSDEDMIRLFEKAAARGAGIELNACSLRKKRDEARLRPYRIAKEAGCRFYLGSDAHSPDVFAWTTDIWREVIDLLGLTESDKCRLHLPVRGKQGLYQQI